MALRVLIDGRRAQGSRAGVGHYTRSIVTHWPSPEDAEVLLDDKRAHEDFAPVRSVVLKGGARWNLRAAWLARRSRSLYFSPESYIVPWLLGRRALITVHDLTSLDLPGKQTRRNVLTTRVFLPATIRRAGAIIVPTERVRADLVRHFPFAAGKVTVISEGAREFAKDAPADAIAAVAGLTPYVLYVGTIEPRKNVLTLIEAFLDAAPADWNLVLAGQVGWLGESELERFTSLVAHDRVHHLGYVPDEWLGTLFGQAELFAYVSESEGFGLPVAEAMAAGLPVIHSDDPALVEVAGGAGIVVSREALAGDLRQAISAATGWSSAERQGHVDSGLAASGRLDWTVAARETERVLRTLG